MLAYIYIYITCNHISFKHFALQFLVAKQPRIISFLTTSSPQSKGNFPLSVNKTFLCYLNSCKTATNILVLPLIAQ